MSNPVRSSGNVTPTDFCETGSWRSGTNDNSGHGHATEALSPNIADINAHLYALFSPEFVSAFPDAWIEIAYAHPDNGNLNQAQNFTAFDLQEAGEFAAAKNAAGYNVYVG